MKFGNRTTFALGRLKSGEMNQTEAAYAKELEYAKAAGIVLWYRFEGLKLRLADNTFFTPDFAVMLHTGEMQCREVKGFWQDDARVKIKVAAEMYPFRFVAISGKKAAKRDGGAWVWKVEDFS